MTKRMIVAALALAGIFIAAYLTLHKLGYLGELVCAVGACELVNASRWATFLGLPVAAWGIGYYVATFATAMLGLRDRWLDSMLIARALLFLGVTGFLFSAWLTYLELFVIHAICLWCVVSAVLATAIFVVSVMEYRELKNSHEDGQEVTG